MSQYKAAAYIRLSYTNDRSTESDSVGNQRRIIEDFVARNPDIALIEEKVDDGYTGLLFDRPAYKDMMDDITSGKINCVIVKDLSRLGREYIETGRYLRRIFPAYGVRFISITDNIDTAREQSSDDLTISIKNIMNESYSRDISVKTRTALDVKRRNGDFVGSFTVYGYLKSEENRNKLIPDPYAGAVVQDIFRMRLGGVSAAGIAEKLNALGILSPLAYKKRCGLPHARNNYTDREDCRWSATTVLRILSDETYTGTLVQGKMGTPHYKIKEPELRPSSEWIRTADAHEALVSRQDFDLVQRIRQLDTRHAPGEETVYLFSGLLICGCCGGPMSRKTVRAGERTYVYYYCPTGKKRGCSHPVMLKETSLIDCVTQTVKGYIANVSSLEALMRSTDAESIARAMTEEYAGHIEENERKLAQTLRYRANLYESLTEGIITKTEYANLKQLYSRQEEEIRTSIRLLNEKLDEVRENRDERNRWIRQFTDFTGMETLDRKAVVQMIRSITVLGKTEIRISFAYEDEYRQALSLLEQARAAERKAG
jgi:DNA invertase Pin-like site-specific DNA recombinase